MKQKMGLMILVLIHLILFVLVLGYVGIACSMNQHNFFHIAYEPSGLRTPNSVGLAYHYIFGHWADKSGIKKMRPSQRLFFLMVFQRPQMDMIL